MPNDSVNIRLRADGQQATASFQRFSRTAKGLAEGMSASARAFKEFNSAVQVMTRGMGRASATARDLANRQAEARRAGAALASSMAASGRATQQLHTYRARLTLGMRQAGMSTRQQAAAQNAATTANQKSASSLALIHSRIFAYAGGGYFVITRLTDALTRQLDAYTVSIHAPRAGRDAPWPCRWRS